MKIAIAQLNYHIGNFELNTSKIIDCINKSKAAGADLVVFSELSVTGYYPHDLLERKEFVEQSYKAIDQIADCCTGI
ncbi:MAG: nitrilase-related carbon-nitrogen hydrolase, partial [Bacteroidota bacterium]|nr:nitrilase-related carbon-nitrogen hydrolase [Bacteroidota bacterium]